MSVETYTKTGAKASSSAKLPKDVFAEKVENLELLKLAYESNLAEKRTNNAKVITRGQARGGGRKPWRQKGTGRARVGSIRSPLWRSGGITFGPTGEENYSKKLPKKAKNKALRQALSLAFDEKRIKVIETFECKDGKVSTTAKLLKKLDAQRSTLIVVSRKDDLVKRATNNLPNVKVSQANYLTVRDVLDADHLVISKKSLDLISDWLGGSAS